MCLCECRSVTGLPGVYKSCTSVSKRQAVAQGTATVVVNGNTICREACPDEPREFHYAVAGDLETIGLRGVQEKKIVNVALVECLAERCEETLPGVDRVTRYLASMKQGMARGAKCNQIRYRVSTVFAYGNQVMHINCEDCPARRRRTAITCFGKYGNANRIGYGDTWHMAPNV